MIMALVMAAVSVQDTARVHSGVRGEIEVSLPRFDSTALIDGRLDEGVWSRAARLVDFSQYQPVDGRPAEDPTEVLVWYGRDAIYFGVRAQERHGEVVRATRANRDNIGSEDQIQILLDTYNDRRTAFLFGVNPLGVQQDGTRSDNFSGGAGGRFDGGGGVGNVNPLEGTVDLNPDYVFESRGRLVDGGYEIEVRIPFKSLRYQEGATQAWGLNVLRRVQHSGFQDSWTPAVRGNASFLGQSGTLTGLRDLHRGLVLELTPTVTGRLVGSRSPSGRWDYEGARDLGGDVRWGISQNLSLNGAINPDFSQVEADVGQVTVNERFALFFPEKRPFFLDGLELFDTPGQLIYTRRIVSPDAGLKLAGKVGRLNIATLVAADGASQSIDREGNPIFGVTRLRTDLGRNSTLGGVFTTREDGTDHSRLVGADLRLYHSKLYFVQLQAVQSWTKAGLGGAVSGPLLSVMWDRTGRGWGFNYQLRAVGPDFNAAAGFVNRTDLVEATAFNRFSRYGRPGALVETYGAFIGVQRLWSYSDPGAGPREGYESVFPSATLRGGWQVGGSVNRNFFSYNPRSYQGYAVEVPGGTVSFSVPASERGLVSGSVRVTTPTFQHLTVTASLGLGDAAIFREAIRGRQVRFDITADLRPTSALRGALQFTRLSLDRGRDGSRFSTETIPRLKVEYQLNRAVFVRLIGQYTARTVSPLLDPLGRRILQNGVVDQGKNTNELQLDWLFSYRPTPGTLVYFGYGSTSSEPESFRFGRLERREDGFFGKVSYLFRM
ncbi:MAG: carbohydrate binding family 9 domain-containing protein [Gemmatimonadetes bacterium]|nr:carbohydrate binding family 9 domain-containing protein [Gemmatimonadota bacterium]